MLTHANFLWWDLLKSAYISNWKLHKLLIYHAGHILAAFNVANLVVPAHCGTWAVCGRSAAASRCVAAAASRSGATAASGGDWKCSSGAAHWGATAAAAISGGSAAN